MTNVPEIQRQNPAERDRVPVWDIFVRLFHWGLVATLSFALLSGLWLRATWIDAHIVAGSAAGLLVLSRIIWGFTGPTHARFSDFVTGPRWTLHHMGHLLQGKASRYRGHNPLGGWMVLTLLAVVLALALTGVTTLGGLLHGGPLASLPVFVGDTSLSLHRSLGWGILGLVVLHVAGALLESLREHENLVRAMVTGKKERRDGDRIWRPRTARPLVAFSATLLVVLPLMAVGLKARPPVHAAPTTARNPAYDEECSACHDAYHPSLLRASDWRGLMATLDDHFGEDASLDAETTAEIRTYLTAHAADVTDTRVAKEVSTTDPAWPYSPSHSRFWVRTHASISDAVFTAPPVYGRFNCSACHKDASSGWFYPGRIVLPSNQKAPS